jgi:chloramphenicol 3-O phosphotransferase
LVSRIATTTTTFSILSASRVRLAELRPVDVGWVVILNGAPRSGKTSIARALIEAKPGTWANHGVDEAMKHTPPELLPGIGLRPGGERPDLEPEIPRLFESMYAEVAALARRGVNVAVDVGHHDDYSEPLGIRGMVGEWLTGLPVFWVGVRCPIAVVLERRAASDPEVYVQGARDGVPAPVVRWQESVHAWGEYDLEIDTSMVPSGIAASRILDCVSKRS